MSRSPVIVRNTAFLLAGQVITWTFSLVYLVLVPRAIGPFAFGQLSLATAITSLAGAILGLSLTTLLVKEIASNVTRAADYIGAALTMRVILAIPLMVVVAGIAVAGGYDAQTRLVIGIFTLGAVVSFLAGPLGAGLMAFERMHFTALTGIINSGLLSMTVVALFWVTHVDAVDIAVVGLGATLVTSGLQLYWLSRSMRIRLSLNWPLIRSLVIGSLPFAVTYILLTFYVWIDSVMLSFLASTLVVGWYGAATRLFTALLFIPTTLSTALLPALSHSFKHDRSEMSRLIHQSFTLTISLSLPIAAGTVMLAPAAVRLLYGSAYAPSGTILIVLALSVLPTYISILANQILVASDRQIIWARVMGVMCIVNPAINLVAITYFQHTSANGALGASYALLATETLMAVVALRLLPRSLLKWSALTPVMRSAVATAVMCVCVWLLRDRFLLVPVAVGTLVYFGAALALRVFPAENLALIGSVATKVARRLGLRYRLRSSAADQAAGLPPALLDVIAEDLRVWKRMGFLGNSGDSEPLSGVQVARLWWGYLGVRATLLYRLSAEAHRLRIPLLPGMLMRYNLRHYGLDIVPSVPIGPGLYIPHPVGTVIMARALGRNCQIISGVTIGMRDRHEFPVIGDDVFLGAGARVLGGIHVGNGAQIGANAVVLRDVPADATAVGVPARILPSRHDWQSEVLPEEDQRLAVLAGTHSSAHATSNGNGHHGAGSVHSEAS